MPYPIATVDPDILGGMPTFAGTRVPVAVLFENLADGLSLNQILDAYPTISRDIALRALVFAQNAVMEAAMPRPSTALEFHKEPATSADLPASLHRHGRYLANPQRRAKSHIWIGNDTLCKMWSTGGLKRDSYEVAEQPGLNGICSMCSAADRT